MSRHGRVPLRHQLTATECAAACLAMIVSHHGRDTTVAECRDLVGGGRDGVSVSRVAAAAARLGLVPDVSAATDPLAVAARDAQPAIAYLANHHFVVVERVTRTGVRVADPSTGRQWQSREDFLARYGGLRIELTPGPDFVPRRSPLRESFLMRYLREVIAAPGGRRFLALIVVLAAALKALGLAMPLATQYIVDDLVPQQRTDLLPQLALGVGVTAVLVGAVTFARARALIALRARADTILGRRFVGHMLRLPLPYFLQRTRGDLLMRLGSVSTTREIVTSQVLTLVLDAALLVGYLIGLALLVPGYIPVVMVLALAQLAILARAFPRISALAQRELVVKAEEQSRLVETLEAIAPVKANGIEARAVARWDELFGRTIAAMMRRAKATAQVEAAHHALATLAPLAFLWLGMAFVLDGTMTLGTALAANAVALSLLGPVQTLASVGQLYPSLRSQIERMYDVMDAAEEPSGTVRLPRDEPAEVRLDRVSFGYQRDAAPVIAEVSLSVPRRAKVAIVGRTGSGKSTIALLVLGLLRADRGHVQHDGVDVAALDVHDMRGRCGVVLQDLNLFSGSIRDNLALGRPDATTDDLTRAAEIAGLHADVMNLPMGYDTLVGEGGAALSAGQRQRVALARALVHRPSLLILDEATSHLDPETERRVDAALSRLDVTRIVISHRVSAIRNADQIYVLDAGRLVAHGRHEDLSREGGIYCELFADGQPPAVSGVPGRPGTVHMTQIGSTTQGSTTQGEKNEH
jgi:ATP-binding cassette, subfamily B, bacterial